MISPEEYAAALAKTIPAQLQVHVVPGATPDEVLYEVKIGGKLMARLEKDHAVSFLDGVIAGVNLARWHDNGT